MLRELDDEPTGLDELDPATAPLELDRDDLPAVRRVMIRLQQLEREIDRVDATKRAVAATYDEQLARLGADRQWLRSSLQAWVERNGTAKFPDVGTAYLAKGDPKVEVADRDALKRELGDLFTKATFDETGAKAYALEQALKGNPLPAGVNVVPGGPRLQIRKAG